MHISNIESPDRLRRRIRLSTTLVLLICSMLALIGGSALLGQQVGKTLEQLQRQSRLSAHLGALQGVLLTLADAETGQRGYLLTGKSRYLSPYRDAAVRIPQLAGSLSNIQLLDPTSQARIDKARVLIELKLAELHDTVQLETQKRHDAAMDLVLSDVGQAYTEQIRAEVAAIFEIVRKERDSLALDISAGEVNRQRLLILSVSLFVLFISLATAQTFGALRARTRLERLLTQSEHKHRALVEEQTELVSQVSVEGTLAYVNPAYAKYFGHAPNELVGASLYEFVAPCDRDALEEHFRTVLQTGAPLTNENRVKLPDGQERWIAWTNRRQVGEDGNFLVHSVGRDLTERKALEEKLAASEHFLRQIADNIPVRIAYADRDMRYRFANLALCQRFGKSPAEILGQRRSELTGEATSSALLARVHDVLAGERQRFEFEEVVDGETRCIESQLIPDFDTSGTVKGYYVTAVDITERTSAERALRELTEIIEHTPDYVIQTDWRGRVHYLNPAVRQVLELTADAPAQSMSFEAFNTPETNARFTAEIVPTVKTFGVWTGEACIYAAHHRIVPVSLLVIGHRDVEGRVARYSAVMRDISEEIGARQRLQSQTATLQSVTEAIPAVVGVVGADERYRFVNRALEDWLGKSREDIVGKTGLEILGEAEYARSKFAVDKVLAGETVNFEKAFPNRTPPQHMAVSFIPLRLDTGVVDGFVFVVQDVTHHRQEAVRLLDLAERDPLTGLLNRAGFDAFLQRAVEGGHAASLALLYIDLDHFKPVNDEHGHPVGDQVLRQVAQRLKALVRPNDAVARLGGDEFAVVLSGVREEANIGAVAEKILESMHRSFKVDARTLRIGASIGMAFDASDSTGVRGLVARADAKLYIAKAAGRGRKA